MRRSANGADDDRHGLRIREDDFTRAEPPAEPARVNLLIANPPYVRHHHIDGADKIRLKQEALRRLGIDVSRLAGLYVHFLLLSHEWMADGGVAAWLIPSEWMDVNYGAALKRYLLEQVSLLEIHLFDAADVQFGDALVSSGRRLIVGRAGAGRPNRGGGFRPVLFDVGEVVVDELAVARPRHLGVALCRVEWRVLGEVTVASGRSRARSR